MLALWCLGWGPLFTSILHLLRVKPKCGQHPLWRRGFWKTIGGADAVSTLGTCPWHLPVAWFSLLLDLGEISLGGCLHKSPSANRAQRIKEVSYTPCCSKGTDLRLLGVYKPLPYTFCSIPLWPREGWNGSVVFLGP